ncbi:MAG: hypothetical protein IKE41_04560, partial [Clostridia bacterium]|nr:hypothetical protein [Clostridia bacterium]
MDMRLKKLLCGLVSAGMLLSSLSGVAGAIPVKTILEEQSFQGGSVLSGHIAKLQEFIEEEKSKLLLEGGYYLENIQRVDYLAFGIFCCFCYKHDLNRCIDRVVKQRNTAERREDISLIEHMADNHDQFSELCKRFEIGDMPAEEISGLVQFIRMCYAKNRTNGKEGRKPGRSVREE